MKFPKTNLEIKRKETEKWNMMYLRKYSWQLKIDLGILIPNQERLSLKKLLFSVDIEYIFSNKKDENYIRKQVGERYKGNVNIISGILTEDAAGKIKEDFTFETILSYVFENNLKEIRDISFSEVEYGFKCSLL